MTQNKTINSQIEEIKKGCGKKFDTFKYEDMKIRVECDRFRLCELCQAKLSTLQECQKMFLEEIDKIDDEDSEDIILFKKELKSKIGGEDGS